MLSDKPTLESDRYSCVLLHTSSALIKTIHLFYIYNNPLLFLVFDKLIASDKCIVPDTLTLESDRWCGLIVFLILLCFPCTFVSGNDSVVAPTADSHPHSLQDGAIQVSIPHEGQQP